MDFTVTPATGEDIAFSGEAKYKILENGVLRVTSADGDLIHWSPTGWLRVSGPATKSEKPRVTVLP